MKTRSLVWLVVAVACVAIGAWVFLSGGDNVVTKWFMSLHGRPAGR